MIRREMTDIELFVTIYDDINGITNYYLLLHILFTFSVFIDILMMMSMSSFVIH